MPLACHRLMEGSGMSNEPVSDQPDAEGALSNSCLFKRNGLSCAGCSVCNCWEKDIAESVAIFTATEIASEDREP